LFDVLVDSLTSIRKQQEINLMTRMKLILNPQADHGHAGEKDQTLHQLVAEEAAQQGSAFEVDWVETGHPGHASDLAEQAAKENYDRIVAIGGDGTIHEIVNGLMRVEPEQRPQIGILPVGSGNDFAHNVGIPDTLEEAVRWLFGQQARAIDVLSVIDGTGRQEYFDNTMGIGFTGAVAISTRSKKRWRGFMLYLVAVLETILFNPPALKIVCRFNDDPPVNKAISTFSICNGPREGGGFPVAPDALMDDGLISWMIMRRLRSIQILYYLPIVMNANHLNHKKAFTAGTAEKLHIKSDSPMAIHIDGEIYGPWEADVREVEVSIFPGAVQVLCES
jgi:YegS/Rv2252/BmrU family lipid kinase